MQVSTPSCLRTKPQTVPPPKGTTPTATATKTIKVLLVDDQPIIAEYTRRLLAEESDMQLFYCKQASQAIPMAIDIQPTII